MLIIGAGWIGLEVAAAARAAGVEVTVLEAAELPLLRVLGPQVAPVFADLHREHGVDLRLGVRVAEITGSGGKAAGVRLADGTRIGADAVIVGIGAAPQHRAGRGGRPGRAQRGGDATRRCAPPTPPSTRPATSPTRSTRCWARTSGSSTGPTRCTSRRPPPAAMLGQDAVYDRVPYFFTDQYDLGMEYAGYVGPGGYDQVVFRGDVGKREFIAFWLSGGRVLAGMNVNIWDVTDAIQALIRSGRPVDPARLADPAVPLEEVVAS